MDERVRTARLVKYFTLWMAVTNVLRCAARKIFDVVDDGAMSHRAIIHNIKYLVKRRRRLTRGYFKGCVFGSGSGYGDKHAHLPGTAH
jgi:hypothetical protein